MRVMVVAPGASFSTHDVYTGLVGGLRAHGVTVIEGRLDTILGWYGALIREAISDGTLSPDAITLDGRLNRSALASAHITRAALIHRPDWVLVVSGHNYNAHDATALRRAGIPVAILLTESPYWAAVETEIARHYNLVFTNERQAVAHLRAAGLNAYYLPHAYDPAVHTPDGAAADPCDVFFCGSLFDERRALFSAADWTGLSFVKRGYHLDTGVADLLPNTEVAAHYRAAAVNLNHHRTTMMHGSGQHIAVGEAESLGPRAYEIAACRAFQLMDDSRAEALDVFGASLATYRAGDAADLTRQVRYWLEHPEERAAMAEAQHRAVQGHSWHNRAAELLDRLERPHRAPVYLPIYEGVTHGA